jgi:hypothetical protein
MCFPVSPSPPPNQAVFSPEKFKINKTRFNICANMETKTFLIFFVNNSVCYRIITPYLAGSPKSDSANFCQFWLPFSAIAGGQPLQGKSIMVDFKKGGVLKNFPSKKAPG